MRILLTEDRSCLGKELASELSEAHQVCALPAAVDPFDPSAIWQQMRGIDVVIHTGQFVTEAAAQQGSSGDRARLDEATRGTCILLEAAVESGVRRILYCSTLELFARMPADRYISEHWRPDPGPEAGPLSQHLAEQVTREFARVNPVSVTVLRLGRLIREEDVAPGTTPDLMWCDPRDAAAAVGQAVSLDRSDQLNWQSRWAVVHVCSQPPHPQFLLDGARRLGWEPQHNFSRQWSAA